MMLGCPGFCVGAPCQRNRLAATVRLMCRSRLQDFLVARLSSSDVLWQSFQYGCLRPDGLNKKRSIQGIPKTARLARRQDGQRDS